MHIGFFLYWNNALFWQGWVFVAPWLYLLLALVDSPAKVCMASLARALGCDSVASPAAWWVDARAFGVPWHQAAQQAQSLHLPLVLGIIPWVIFLPSLPSCPWAGWYTEKCGATCG